MPILEGKVAIVTGAAKGIGRAASVELAKAGAKVVMAGIRESSMGEVKEEVKAITSDSLIIQTDVSKWDDAQRMAAKTVAKFGRIDILVSNAGIHPLVNGLKRTLLEIDEVGWDEVIDVNLKGQFNCVRAVAPTMMAQRSGNIVMLSSSTALSGLVASVPYAASKAGVIGMMRVLAKELGPYYISVNAVAPGYIQTPMNESVPQETREGFKSRIPLGRGGVATDVAQAILYFCSPDLFTTAQVLVVDGGSTPH